MPENWGIYNVVINDYGTDTEQIDNWLSCHYRYIVSGFNETDIIQLMSLLETDKNGAKRLIGRDYRIAFNFGEPSMCGEQYRYLCSNLETSARITMNGFLPYKFNLPQWFLQTCDTEFENYRMYIRNICLCLDNDSAGRAASATIRQKLMSIGYMNVYERFSREKDYNEELMMVRKTEIEISYE